MAGPESGPLTAASTVPSLCLKGWRVQVRDLGSGLRCHGPSCVSLVFEGGLGNEPDCIVILLSITNVPDTQSIREEVQLLEVTQENMPNVIPDLLGDL